MTQYKVDVFTESPPKDEDKIMGAAYLEKVIECENLKDVSQFIADNAGVMRALGYIEGTRAGVAGRIFDLHKRHAKEVTEGLKTMMGGNLDGVIKGTLPPDCLLRISYETGSPLTMPAVERKEPVEQQQWTDEVIHTIGRFRYRDGFGEVWFGEEHYDLRERKKARLCIEYLVQKKAFDVQSARHFLEEIDPYVRKKGDYPAAADIKIDHYFNDLKGRLPKLRKDLILAAGRNGKFYLKTD